MNFLVGKEADFECFFHCSDDCQLENGELTQGVDKFIEKRSYGMRRGKRERK